MFGIKIDRLFKEAKRIIFISPHLDDAVLSCGGLINFTSKRRPVEIWTAFSGAPLIPRKSRLVTWLHEITETSNAMELVGIRKREDKEASEKLNASARHFRFLDCAYRVDRRFRPLYPETVFVKPHPRDKQLIRSIANTLSSNLKNGDVLFCPLAIGDHVDHFICREAVRLLNLKNVCYYQDIPYAMPIEIGSPETLNGLNKVQVNLPAPSVDCWWEATRKYRSQLAMIDPDGKKLFSYIKQFKETPFCFFSAI